MKGTVLLAGLSVVLLFGLAVFVRSRAVSAHSSIPPEVAEAVTRERPAARTPLVVEASLERPAVTPTNSPPVTNLYARFRDGEIPHVSREQLEPFLTKHHRGVDALLGALRASGNDALLKEAKERFPNDPRVQFAAAFKSESPEERQQWLERLKQSDPDNSMANYLLAGEHFKAGQVEQALQELTAATGKTGFDNHLLDFMQNAEEAYRAAGCSEAEAKSVACSTALLPELARLKQVSVDLVELAKRYQQAGDTASAQSVLEMGMNLGRRLGEKPQTTIIQELVGTAIERIILNAMTPDAAYGAAGQTVKSQSDALADRRKTIRALTEATEPILTTMSDQELGHFYDRLKLYGETAALRWVLTQAPPK